MFKRRNNGGRRDGAASCCAVATIAIEQRHYTARMRSRRGAIFKLVLLLVFGILLNVAVAWGISIVLDPFKIDPPTPNRYDWGRLGARVQDEGFFHAHVLSCTGAARLSAGMREAGEFERDHAEDPRDVVPGWWVDAHAKFDKAEPFYSRAEARGWPMMSMWHGVEHHDGATARSRTKSIGGIVLPLPIWVDPEPYSSYDQPRTLPLRIIWPGFAINTFFYAGVLWMVVFVPGAIRRTRRLARGRCPRCAYPMGSSALCTECGGSLTRRVQHSDGAA